MKLVDLELFTRPGCHLCDEMKAALLEAGRGFEIRLREVDISGSSELETRYGNDIPVLFVNGAKAFEHRATVEELRARLQKEA